MQSLNTVLRLACVIALCSCAINHIKDEKTVITLPATGPENARPMVISLVKGSQWWHKITPGPFVIYIYPQVVFWMEDAHGHFIKTLYVTGADGKFAKHATKKKMGAAFFRECFPVWSNQIEKAGLKLPGSTTPYSDAVTSATPQSSFAVATHIGQTNDSFIIYAEINKTGDYNDYYTEDRTGWIGQPSIVYSVMIDPIAKDQTYFLKPAGHGSTDKDTPVLREGFDNITTALEMVREISVVFDAPAK